MHIQNLPLVSAFICLLFLGACTGPTPYMPLGESGNGYSEQKLESGRYRVTFAGNELTRKDTVEDYMLYRAAELTISTGHQYFQVVSKDTDKSTSYRYTGPDVGVFGGSRGWGTGVGWRFGTGYGGSESEQSFSIAVEILLKKGAKPEGDPNAYDAADILASLGPKIIRPKEE